MKSYTKLVIGGAVLALLALVATTSWFRVQEYEEALVLTMGQATRQVTKGVHAKMPWPLERVIVKPVSITQQMTFGYRESGSGYHEMPDEALMITGDESLVWADLLVEWRITSIKDYVFNAEQPEALLRNAVSASLRSVMGSTNLDFAITTGKFELQAEVENRLRELMDDYNVGISIISVKLQDVEPPDAVKNDFKAVTDAREARVTKVNEANKYRNERLPVARGEAQQMIERAQGEKALRVNEAIGDVAQFKALYEAYLNSPEITERRLILETLGAILPGADITIVESGDGTVKYLPINPRRGE